MAITGSYEQCFFLVNNESSAPDDERLIAARQNWLDG